jgi:two-component system, response regulator YesN
LIKDDYIALFDKADSFEELWHTFITIVSDLMNQLDLKVQNLNEVVVHIKDFIGKNYYSDKVTLDYLSNHFYIDPFSLSKIFKRLYGQNLHYYITKLRIERAVELLADSKLKIFEISEMVGYNDEKYFSRLFKKVMHSTPNEYRKKLEL